MSDLAGYVYAIENTVNGHRYIGSTTNYKSRWHTHRSTLRRGVHHSFILQKAWGKYGAQAFEFKLLLVCPKNQRIEYENLLMPLQYYNVMRTAKESLVRGGWHHSDEFKAKLSVLHAGKTLTDEHRAKLSLHRKGRIENNLFREKARARQVGVIPSTQTKQKLSAALVNARANEVSIAKQKTRDVHALCLLGEKVYATCKQHQISPPTFYKYVALLQLPLLGHKSRGATS
jgi:group I intron endonuclease